MPSRSEGRTPSAPQAHHCNHTYSCCMLRCPPTPPDFRKDYTRLSFFKQRYPTVPLLALTATATPRVQHDVVAQLGINRCLMFKSSFNRSNCRRACLGLRELRAA